MAIVVNTIQAQPRWAAPHVGEEGSVAISPTLTDSDAACAVVPEITTVRVVAAGFHIEPSRVLAGAFLAIGLTVGFAEGAATALRAAFGQAGLVDQHTGTAVAEAPIAGAVGDAAMAVALRARRAERHDLEIAEALGEHTPLWGRPVTQSMFHVKHREGHHA